MLLVAEIGILFEPSSLFEAENRLRRLKGSAWISQNVVETLGGAQGKKERAAGCLLLL